MVCDRLARERRSILFICAHYAHLLRGTYAQKAVPLHRVLADNYGTWSTGSNSSSI